MKKSALLLLCCLLSMLVVAEGKEHKGHDGLLIVKDAFIRALPPGQPNTAAFLTMTNPKDKAYTLSKIYSDAAETVELHSHEMNDGKMQMRPIELFTIKAKETIVFAPGKNHIMFIGLKKPLKEGEEVLLNMCFEEFCQLVNLPVVSVLNEKAGQHRHH